MYNFGLWCIHLWIGKTVYNNVIFKSTNNDIIENDDTPLAVIIALGEDIVFRWYSYAIHGDKQTLVQYLGNDAAAKPFPHGNSKSDSIYVRSCTSVLKTIQKYHQSPSAVYKQVVANASCPPAYQPVLVARNIRQVKIFKWNIDNDSG